MLEAVKEARLRLAPVCGAYGIRDRRGAQRRSKEVGTEGVLTTRPFASGTGRTESSEKRERRTVTAPPHPKVSPSQWAMI